MVEFRFRHEIPLVEDDYSRDRSWSSCILICQTFLVEISFLVCSIAGLLVLHPSLGTSAVDVLSSLGTMNPKVGVALLLVTLFFSNISTCKEGVSGDIMVSYAPVLFADVHMGQLGFPYLISF